MIGKLQFRQMKWSRLVVVLRDIRASGHSSLLSFREELVGRVLVLAEVEGCVNVCVCVCV